MAEELIELGQTSAMPSPAAPRRAVSLSRQEAEIVVRTVEAVVEFAGDFPLEFHAYCPPDRWKDVLTRAGSASQDIERQLSDGVPSVSVDASSLMAVMDLEECVSGARDRRLSSGKVALMVSAAGAIGEVLLGLPWLGLPAYIISLAMVLGRPLAARIKEVPAEPFKVGAALSGSGCAPTLGDHTDKAKVIERVIVSPSRRVQRHHWGVVYPGPSGAETAHCLTKGRFRVRVEGWSQDRVEPAEGWEPAPLSACMEARHEISVWEPCGREPRPTPFGPPLAESGHENTFWAEYTGPLTGGICRRAGPFG